MSPAGPVPFPRSGSRHRFHRRRFSAQVVPFVRACVRPNSSKAAQGGAAGEQLRRDFEASVRTLTEMRQNGRIALLARAHVHALMRTSRLREFGGGVVPPAVRIEIEWRRRQLGLSQIELAAMIGRSQGQLANALRGHDPISRVVVNRLRDILIRRGSPF